MMVTKKFNHKRTGERIYFWTGRERWIRLALKRGRDKFKRNEASFERGGGNGIFRRVAGRVWRAWVEGIADAKWNGGDLGDGGVLSSHPRGDAVHSGGTQT